MLSNLSEIILVFLLWIISDKIKSWVLAYLLIDKTVTDWYNNLPVTDLDSDQSIRILTS